MNDLFHNSFGVLYQNALKPILFQLPPTVVHTRATKLGEMCGKIPVAKRITASIFRYYNILLQQNISGITFQNPIGLAAGFDYEARLTQLLPAIGYGFGTVGTITNNPYKGNPPPMLGRLPHSQSLMVNKGFKNLGARETINKLSNRQFAIPIGISIGRTNSQSLATQKTSIADILTTFTHFEQSAVKHAYYELNISCPNLYGDVTFYPPQNLKELLKEIDKLHLTRPVFIKMPIEKSDQDVSLMLEVIAKHSPTGVIFGNLQKDRNNPLFDQTEIKKYPLGNFSGKPTFERSNQLIALTYKRYKHKLIIIGCGGVFSAEDAYTKITLGASLVQLITGMIFVGPQLISEINMRLVDFLQKDGFTHISQAIGSKNKI